MGGGTVGPGRMRVERDVTVGGDTGVGVDAPGGVAWSAETVAATRIITTTFAVAAISGMGDRGAFRGIWSCLIIPIVHAASNKPIREMGMIRRMQYISDRFVLENRIPHQGYGTFTSRLL